jgi:translation initiation factor 5
LFCSELPSCGYTTPEYIFLTSTLHARFFADENGDKDYIKNALLGKKEDDDDEFGDDDDDDDDASAEAGVDDAGALQLAVDASRKFLNDNPEVSDADLVEYITNQQMASALKSHDKIHILALAAFTPQFFKNKEIHRFASAISSIAKGNRIMNRHLISAIESICMTKPKQFPVMLKQLYDEDALDEETILEWADQGRSEFTLSTVDEEARALLRGEAEPVVVWLQEAESDDEESGCDE